jgi:hypothetical protein
MNRKIAWTFLTILLFVMLAGANVYAQSSTKMKVNIPFDFRVGSQSLPAGEYTVVPKSPTMVEIRSKDGHESVPALTNTVNVNPSKFDGRLIFNRYGAYHFLSQILTPADKVGRRLIKSKYEQEVASLSTHSDTTVLIAEKINK